MFVSNTTKSLCLLNALTRSVEEGTLSCLKCCFQTVFTFLATLQWDQSVSVNDFTNAWIVPLAFEHWKYPTGGSLTTQIPRFFSIPHPSSRGRTQVSPWQKLGRDQAVAAPHQGAGAEAEM